MIRIKKLRIRRPSREKKSSLKKKYFRPPSVRMPRKKRLLAGIFILIFFFSAVVLGAFFGGYRAIRENLPDVSSLEEFEPNIITYVYSDQGEVIGEFALEKRVEISYEDIPKRLIEAIIATEDPRFYHHHGIDFLGILRAVRENLRFRRRSNRLQGGSTITQQLARLLFLHPKQTLRRKFKEMLLSLEVEKKFSKEKILTMYCNQFYLGHGVYGVEAASQLFFGKSVKDLSLEEIAMIAGIFRGGALYSPYTREELTLRRRNHVINRMAEEGYISKEEAEEAKKKPMEVLPLRRGKSEFAAYFLEEVRKYVEKKYGADALYRRGLRIYTTLNPEYQRFAEEALRKQLRVLDKRQGWRDDKRNLILEGVDNYQDVWLHSWVTPMVDEKEIVEAIVLKASTSRAAVKVKDYTGRMTNKGIEWTGKKKLSELIKEGDIIQVKVNKVDEEKKELEVSLDQEPLIEGAFLGVEPQTGQIKAMVGGYSFARSKWNRATQATRQTGSAIKPILYTAAIENGFTPATIIIDEPTEFFDKWSDEPYKPENYDQKYKGAVTLRIGLEESRNIVTAKLLEYISPQTGVDYCRKFGITSPVYPYLSLSLGAFEVSLLELVSAYSVFPNKGVRIKPYFIRRIEDKNGTLLEENTIEAEKVISPQTAFIMTYLLQGVIQRGTGWSASYLLKDKPLAGKTGTTDEYTDAWFVGFSPSLCAGVWIGHNTKIPIGERQSGAVAALPVWRDFFQSVIEAEKKKQEEEGENDGEALPQREYFEEPPNISWVTIDRKTGLLATPFCLYPFREAFLPGTEPKRYCSHEDHMMIYDYYSLKKKKDEDR
ncbi:MAG: penicillin-binding protein 1A [Candidatus Aminicenantales bacterium]